MAESSSFTSLFDLVDSHLSKIDIKESYSEDTNDSFSNLFHQSLNNLQKRSKQSNQSETELPSFLGEDGENINLPFKVENNSTQKVLNMQIANMIKAKQLRKHQEEMQKLQEEVKKVKLEEDNYMIDLTDAIIKPLPNPPKGGDKRSSSVESLYEPQFIDNDELKDAAPAAPAAPLLPCTTDLSYILLQPKPWKSKCSHTAKILTTRLKPVAAPYLHEKPPTNIKRFKFDTMSPCDIIKNKLKKPEYDLSCMEYYLLLAKSST